MDICFGVRVPMTGALGDLWVRASRLCQSGFTPLTAHGLYIILVSVNQEGFEKCETILKSTTFQTTGFSMRIGQQLGYDVASGIVWADVKSIDLDMLRIELIRLLRQEEISADPVVGATLHLPLGIGAVTQDLTTQIPTRGTAVPIGALYMLTPDENHEYNVYDWNYLTPNQQQTKHLAGNKPPPRHRAPTSE